MKRLFALLLCQLMALSIISPATTFAKCAHKNTKWVTLTEATCLQDGKKPKFV